MNKNSPSGRHSPWAWVPTLYLYQGIPYSIVMTTSVLMYKNMDVDVASFTFWTSLLYLPWTIKPLWSPIVESIGTKRRWIVLTQLIVAMAFAILAMSMQITSFYSVSLIMLAIIAFGSASHDIACDGFYMLALPERQQQFFVGIRTTFYRIAMLVALGGMPIVAGFFQGGNLSADSVSSTEIPIDVRATSWTYAFLVLAAILAMLCIINYVTMPYPSSDGRSTWQGWRIFVDVVRSFFSKKGVVAAMAFLLLYRLGEAQLAKIATVFLVDSRANGGIAMDQIQYGFAYGSLGMVALTVGGIAGGWLASRFGLRRVIWYMVAFMNLPNLVYVYLACFQPFATDVSVYVAIVIEQLGYGFGFTAYMLFILHYVGTSRYRTAEYAIATAIMAIGMMLPGMISGYMKELLGYEYFFIYVVVCCLPGTLIVPLLRLDESGYAQ